MDTQPHGQFTNRCGCPEQQYITSYFKRNWTNNKNSVKPENKTKKPLLLPKGKLIKNCSGKKEVQATLKPKNQ